MFRNKVLIYAFLTLAALLGAFAWSIIPHTTQARLGGVDLLLERVTTSKDRATGLSGKSSLGHNEGMLFVFPEDGIYSFWMKDMQFPIDILWLDAGYAVVDVAQAVQPDSYPQTFSPRVPARYVVELPAGFFVEHSLKIGNILEILK